MDLALHYIFSDRDVSLEFRWHDQGRTPRCALEVGVLRSAMLDRLTREPTARVPVDGSYRTVLGLPRLRRVKDFWRRRGVGSLDLVFSGWGAGCEVCDLPYHWHTVT